MHIESKKIVSLRSGASARLAIGNVSSEKGSIFKGAIIYPVGDERDAVEAIALLRALPDFSGATHRIAAYIAADKKNYCDDDGEDKAGGALRGILKKLKARGTAIVVARWYGGTNIGKARFEHIRQRARDLLQGIRHQPGEPLTDSLWNESGPGQSLGGTKLDIDAQPLSSKKRELANADDLTRDDDLRKRRRKLFAQAAQSRQSCPLKEATKTLSSSSSSSSLSSASPLTNLGTDNKSMTHSKPKPKAKPAANQVDDTTKVDKSENGVIDLT